MEEEIDKTDVLIDYKCCKCDRDTTAWEKSTRYRRRLCGDCDEAYEKEQDKLATQSAKCAEIDTETD